MGLADDARSARASGLFARGRDSRFVTPSNFHITFARIPFMLANRAAIQHPPVTSQYPSAVYVHLVFFTTDRRPLLRDKPTRDALHSYLGGISKRLDCPPLQGFGARRLRRFNVRIPTRSGTVRSPLAIASKAAWNPALPSAVVVKPSRSTSDFGFGGV